jgi:hypothetical protein
LKLTDVIVVLLFCAVSACSLNAANQAQPSTPAWLQTIISDNTQKPLKNAVHEIWKISHQGNPAYFMISPCCDQFNPLYEQTGRVLCHPSGGMTGRGDGRCPMPADAKSTPQLIWSHPQAQIKQHDASYLIKNDQNETPALPVQ